ncbi:vacuolar protein sorting-associated protein VTA1, putative [Plasmodium gallinaceum]|uniref:Vacuolar protein sorting-associated protein VTA1, putative n=1 Tax=Plasmodium gallinaceum TaxID=5849 RepID=A0A1J1GLT2_PLAGA|nr:vacuolar protein sorting-associated protein VTA1, putative [Plasmodium gallinaceum]CRG93283.1 vacuolar protein sorting-associated protein VTA1, putative [Plasmodium gallinaceum]
MENKDETHVKENKKINKKLIQFILKKSEELEKDHLLISFFCILYIVEQLKDYVKNNYTDIEAKNILINCLNKGEKVRPSFDSLDYNELSEFCKRLFLAADKNDRYDEITKKTLQMFYTCQIFYEILNHFRKLNNEERKKYIYAKYKTIYIKKCFDNNIKPEPGTPKNEKEDISELEEDISKDEITHIETINTEIPCEYIPLNKSDYDTNLQEKKLHNYDENKKIVATVDFSSSLKHAQYAVNDLDTAKHQLKLSLSYLEK